MMSSKTPSFIDRAAAAFRQLWQKSYGPFVVAGAAVLVVGGIVAAATLGMGGAAASSDPTSAGALAAPSATPWEEPEDDKTYDASSGVIDTEVFTGTVLPKTEDAGEDYVKETLFIGDSNTVRYMMYGKADLSNAIGVTSMGAGQITGLKCVDFKGYSDFVTIPKAVEIMQPRRVVVSFGTNNLFGSVDNYITAYKQGLAAIVKAYPYADVIVNAVPPLDKLRQNTNLTMKQVDAFNQALVKMCEEEGYKFLNSSEALKDPATGWAKTDYTLSDGVHLSMKGVEALFEYVRTHAYITEDDRPLPLKKIPGRNETPPDLITSDPIAVRGQKTDNTIQVEFVVSPADAAVIEGQAIQKVAKGELCTKIDAVAKSGWKFSHWTAQPTGSCGGDPWLTFRVPGDADPLNGIVVTAHFVETATPTPEPTATPEASATPVPTTSPEPSATPGATATAEPTATPGATATAEPTAAPTPEPTAAPTPEPTAAPTIAPTPEPTIAPTPEPAPADPPTEPAGDPSGDVPA